jgi:hypothetical protein
MKTSKVGTAAVISAALAGPAWALPPVGDALPWASVEDADGHRVSLAGVAGKPILVVYEDRDSAAQNQALKDELAKLAHGDAYRGAVALVPVADVSAYDFWPARGIVKDAIRDESRKAGTTIYCDWTGRFRSALGLSPKVSNVVLAGRDGKVLFARAGALSNDERARVIRLLRAELGM